MRASFSFIYSYLFINLFWEGERVEEEKRGNLKILKVSQICLQNRFLYHPIFQSCIQFSGPGNKQKFFETKTKCVFLAASIFKPDVDTLKLFKLSIFIYK